LAYTHYDRLTALDTTFLDLESPTVHMHVGSVGQKLARMPVTDHPVWVDDEHFNLLYHVRHTALPLPGDERRLKRLVGRIMSQKLDRAKPMWELWFVEGLDGGQFAVVSKVHHCLIDGISGVDLLSAFMGPDEEYRQRPTDHRWMPRPAPGPLQLLGDEIWRRASLPVRAVLGVARAMRGADETLERTAHTASGFFEGVSKSLSPASETSINVPIGPHRRFDWIRFDLGAVREVKKRLGGTLNDVVLACVSGAVRRFLGDRGEDLAEIDFRAFVPVSTRTDAERGKLGNRVSMIVAKLPVVESDPQRRVARIVEETSQLKGSGQAAGAEVLEEISDWTATGLLTRFSRLAASRRSYNLVVTNVPGPQFPVYLSGSRLLESYPLVPLFENQALGVALFSYDDGLYWGFNADWDAVTDLHDFVLAIEREFQILRGL
jgi:WS/DGAT/MGAT family acyltransferase